MLGLWSNIGKPMLFNHAGELGIFREKPIARVNSVGAGQGRRTQDRGNIEITVP